MWRKKNRQYRFTLYGKNINVNCSVNNTIEGKNIKLISVDSDSKSMDLTMESKDYKSMDSDFQEFVDEIMENIKVYNKYKEINKKEEYMCIINTLDK